MHKYIIKRIISVIPVLLGVTFLLFSLMHITPGDPMRILLGENAPPEAVAEMRAELGLDDPFAVQYFRWLRRAVFEGDLGFSYRTRRPVSTEIMERLPTTLILGTAAITISVVIGVPFGVISAVKHNSIFDRFSMVVSIAGVSMPTFWEALLLILLFAVRLDWLPSSGFDSFPHIILPAFTLGTNGIAVFARLTRATMLEVIRQDYIRTSRAKGQTEFITISRHALRNALIPVVTVVGLWFGGMIAGSVIVESIFSIPGLGRLTVDSINARDFPVVQGGVLLMAVTFSLVNLAVDILYAFLDPRIKSQYK